MMGTAISVERQEEEQEQVVVGGGGLSATVAVMGCAAMAVFYVAILYAPTLILRLPPPASYKSFMIRRFICAAISSLVSIFASALILPLRWHAPDVSSAFGIRFDHLWQALILPLSLTSLMYAGSFVQKCLHLLDSWEQHQNYGRNVTIEWISKVQDKCIDLMLTMPSNISVWRNYIVAPITEELVFRACMVPLLLCGGFSTYTVVFLCPIFFSLAHLNHILEYYFQKNRSLVKASMAAGFQLGYTVIFGSYASFLFVRTGHLIAPLVAHIFCNYMGLPTTFSRRAGMVSMAAFIAGSLGFFWLLFPLTSPHLYNDRMHSCKCWHRYCTWS
ncbi:CAAX prenyl protease 2 [Coffea arabica]|uniref:intramembrane prenyl-peptidase Rce1 n=1 Tax=Coffea arabica TaxID=13443 RepID=A0A6P6SVA5_COFAR|nr:CAAX prenyl protease 2 [Coffea arabica]